MNQQHYPALNQFLGGYFHQDWVDEFSTADNAIDAYLAREPRAVIQQASRELDQLIPSVQAATNPDEILADLGCYYHVQAHGWTVARWLEHLQNKLMGT